MLKKSSRAGLFGIIALAAVLAITFVACGGGSSSSSGGGVNVVLPDIGDGLTAGTAFEISHAGHLKAIANEVNDGNPNYVSAFYKLTANINLATLSLPPAGWTPIGNNLTAFSGAFDGGGFVISSLAIDNSMLNYAGLFGYINNGTVENLGVATYGGVTGNNYVGGVAGWVSNSTVNNIYATGDVTGYNDVGGLVGWVTNSTVNNSYATGDVTGNYYVGGLAGYVTGSSYLSNCYATGDVTGYYYVDELAGDITGSVAVSNCYGTGNVIILY